MTPVKSSRKPAPPAGDVGGDRITTAGNGGVAIGGSVTGGSIQVTNISGSAASVQAQFFAPIYERIDQRPQTSAELKGDLKAEVQEIQTEAAKGDRADESFLARRLRNLARMAPDILDVVIATLANPAAGFALVVRKVAEKARTGL